MLVRSLECGLVELVHIDSSLFGDGRYGDCSPVQLVDFKVFYVAWLYQLSDVDCDRVHRNIHSFSDGLCWVDHLIVALFSWYL